MKQCFSTYKNCKINSFPKLIDLKNGKFPQEMGKAE